MTEMKGKQKQSIVDIEGFLVSEELGAELAVPVVKSLVAAARKESLSIKLQNGKTTPFRIIAEPGGTVMWGVGGCGSGG